MVLNYIWIAFILIAFAVALVQLVVLGNYDIFPALIDSTFQTSRSAFDICLGLTGTLTLWLGIMRVGERGGVVDALARLLCPVFVRLFPDIPKGHPVTGSIFMNIAANMLGLDNAATPMGLKAMKQMQELNPQKETATNPMIMFLVLNTSGLTLIPVTILLYRAQQGAQNPTDVFVPILLATFFSTLAGVVVTSLFQRINLLNRTMLLTLGGASLAVATVIWLLSGMPQWKVGVVGQTVSSVLLMTVIATFVTMAMRRRINVYEAFIEGAKDGFSTAVHIIPYMVAILVAVGLFRTAGCMDLLVDGISWAVRQAGLDDAFCGALPTAMMKPLSGGGARGMMIDAMQTYGADSFVGRLACMFQGSTDTTFYILAVYFGSVGIRHTRHAVTCGLLADLAGILAAIAICYAFFG